MKAHYNKLPFGQASQSWDGVMGQVVSKKADFSINLLAVTKARSQYVTFSSALMQKVNKLYMQMPKQAIIFTTFVKVFDPYFWQVLTVALVVSSICTAMVTFSDTAVARVASGSATVLLAFVGLDANLATSVVNTNRSGIFFLS